MGKAKTAKGKGKKGKKAKPPKAVNGKPDPILTNAAALELEILTLEEAAALLRVSVEGLRADAEKGSVPARWIAGEWRFFTHALRDWLSNLTTRRYTASEIANAPVVPPNRIVKSMPTETRKKLADLPLPDITPEEQEAFRSTLAAQRDEIDRMTKSGKYAEDE